MIRKETLTAYNCMLAFLSTYPGEEWRGTASQLLTVLRPHLVTFPSGRLPPNARSLSVAIQAFEHDATCTAVLAIRRERVGKQRRRCITIQKKAQFSVVAPSFIAF